MDKGERGVPRPHTGKKIVRDLPCRSYSAPQTTHVDLWDKAPGRGTMKEKGGERGMGERKMGAGSFAPLQFLKLGD